ncbi:hypothetical protein HAHE_33310 [Haloferula helveola]|uniref:Alpha-galactosidase n=2 Tax=Haloferula helveola TaxID=490095 RepID=A0ABM7RFW7_9BACT|nr:hypothetical protein HAHE_33310 [Haloferula helveola]
MVGWALLVTACAPVALGDEAVVLGNRFLSREVVVTDGTLGTKLLGNRILGVDTKSGGDEFAISLTDGSGKERRLTAGDFEVESLVSSKAEGRKEVLAKLSGSDLPVDLQVRYWLEGEKPWMRKEISIHAKEDVVVREIAVEEIRLPGAFEPYHADEFTARGPSKWRPPLGQPVYAEPSATWWGVEFPAARNTSEGAGIKCRYLTDRPLVKGQVLKSHPAVWGVADRADFLKDAFFDYIDATRARPLRLQTQYNSWFDYSRGVDAKKFAASVAKVHEELVIDRGVHPLRAYVIDDGWQDTGADWTKSGVWPVNGKFDKDFARSFAATRAADSRLGLWLSPGCLFGAQGAIGKMREAGWESLDPWMSMTGEDYMKALEERMVALAGDGVSYFKLDGVFGHLNQRTFKVEGFKGSEPELNDKKHDEAKERYLSLGSERLMAIFAKMAEANPDVYIVISNGAFLSSWWLQHIDAVWMINAGDAAGGADRTGELVYRDARYYQLASAERDNTQFPLHSIFNHEPKKTSTGEEPDVFRRYLYMNLSRGTGFVELYLKTFQLSESDWEVLAEAMKWVEEVFPNFERSRMHGGDPAKGEAYGYTGWVGESGYLSVHNPSDKPQTYSVVLDRGFGLPAGTKDFGYRVTSPLAGDTDGLPEAVRYGDALSIKLPAKAVRVIEFTAAK